MRKEKNFTQEENKKYKMKLFKYNKFIDTRVLNENLDKAKKFLKDEYLLRTAAADLGLLKGELGEQLKHKEKRCVTMKDFSPADQEKIREKIKQLKIDDEVVKRLEKDTDFIKIRELLKDNLGYIYPFVYFYYVEMVGLDELSNLYFKLIENKQLLDRLPKKFDANFIDPNINNNCEILVDGLDSIEDYRRIKKVYDQLTPILKKDYNESPEVIKSQFDDVARSFNEIGGGDESKKIKLWKSFFGEMKEVEGKLRYFGPLRRYSNIREFIKAAQNYIKSSSNDSIIEFYDKINSCNDKYGTQGADVVFDENGILVIEVKSFPANQMLNGHTRHCIKDYSSQWDSYVTSGNNKQYYIYNFNIPTYDNMSTIGITIGPSQEIKACHAKDDTGISSSIAKKLSDWQKMYNISTNILKNVLKPMSKEEVERRERAKIAEREIIKKGISKEDIIKYVKEDGANINKDGCVALLNAVVENDIDKVKTILNLGGNPNLRAKGESIIDKAQTLDMIKLLVSNGSELTGSVFSNIVHSIDAVEYCLKQGLNPNFDESLPVRRCCVGSWGRDTVGEPYFDALKLLIKYGANVNPSGRPMGVKWAAEHGRIEVIEYMIENKLVDHGFMEAYIWLLHSRKLPKDLKNKTLKYLVEKAHEFEDPKWIAPTE